jgi:HSP20 family molecular chaperone IbpA
MNFFSEFRAFERSLRRFIREFYNDPFFSYFDIPALKLSQMLDWTTKPRYALPPIEKEPSPPRHNKRKKSKGKRKRPLQEEDSAVNTSNLSSPIQSTQSTQSTLAFVADTPLSPPQKKMKTETEDALKKWEEDSRMDWLTAKVSVSDTGNAIEISAYLPGLDKDDLHRTYSLSFNVLTFDYLASNFCVFSSQLKLNNMMDVM